MPSTPGNKTSSARAETLEQLQIELSASECSPSSAQPSREQSHSVTIYSPRKGPFNYSVDIRLKGLSGTLYITWTPNAYPLRGLKKGKPWNRNSTSGTS